MKSTPITDEEVELFRRDTKGTSMKIHFNNAGSSLPPDVVVRTVVDYLQEEAINGGYETEFKYRDELAAVYDSIAALLNASADEVAVVENASMAWSLAFHGLDFNPGDEIITSEMEYVTNVIAFQDVQRNKGVVVRVVPNDDAGNFDMQAFKGLIVPTTRLIAITQIASTTGGMMPVVEIGKVARASGILFLVDACQAAGHLPIDVQEMNCDMLSVTGRKYLRAPRGTGFLYVRKEIQDRFRLFLVDGLSTQWVSETDYRVRDDARRFELYEKSRALTLGLGKAVDYAMSIGPGRIWQRIQLLSGLMRKRLQAIEGIAVHDKGDQLSGIVTFSVAGHDAESVKTSLAGKNINVSVATARGTLFFMNRHGLGNVIRASVHYYNTEEEIDQLISAIIDLNT